MKKTLWSLLIVVVMLLSACGPAFVPTTNPQTPTGEVFMIALPRIVIEYDSAGNPSILGINLASFGANAGGLKLPEQTVAMLTAGNVQHIELAFAGQGVTIFANGKLLP